jgi:ATP-binding cassette, subfamily B, bacterial
MSFILGGLSSGVEVRQQSDLKLIRRLWNYLHGHHWKLGLVVLTLLFNTLSIMLVPIALGQVIDHLSKNTFNVLWLTVAALNGLALLTWLTQYFRQRLTSNAVADVILRAQSDTLQSALKQDHAFYDQTSSGAVVGRITTDTGTLASVVNLSADVLNQMILVTLLSLVLISISPTIALIVSAIVPLIVIVALVFRHLARQAAKQAQQLIAEINARIAETMRGISVAKNYRQEDFVLKEFRTLNQKVYTVSLANNRVFGGIFPLLDIITGLGVALVLYVGGRLVLEGSLTAGSWYLGVQAVTLLLFPLTGIASFWSQFQQGLAATERVSALADTKPGVQQIDTAAIHIQDARVCFNRVNLSYTDGQAVLQDLNLEIPNGQRIALIGRTGSGKTSLLRVLMRFYEFQSGQVTIGGIDLRTIPFAQLGGLVGLVSQTPMLFAGTIADNIRFARPDATDQEVEEAARAVGSTWLEDFKEGLNTPVGERGSLLSQGQRQLVTLARVILQRPAIVLLDEATANVDSFSELQLQQGLNAVMQGRTTIIVAHRLATVMHADRVVILEHGRLVADGTHQSLLKNSTDYALLSARYFGQSDQDDSFGMDLKLPMTVKKSLP